jgi:hypothetical protein
MQSENYMYSRVLGHVQLLIRLLFHRIVLPFFYLPLVYRPAMPDEVRGVEVLVPNLGVLEVCVDRESGMPEWPVMGWSICLYTYCCLHRKLQPYLGYTFIPLHPLKACIQMVT